MSDQANQNRLTMHNSGKRSSLHLSFQEKKDLDVTQAVEYVKPIPIPVNNIDHSSLDTSKHPSKASTDLPVSVSAKHPQIPKSTVDLTSLPKLESKSDKKTNKQKDKGLVSMKPKLVTDNVGNQLNIEPPKSCIKSNEDVSKQSSKERTRSTTITWRIGRNVTPTRNNVFPALFNGSGCPKAAGVDLVFQDSNSRELKKKQLFLPLPPSGSANNHHSHKNEHHHQHHHREGPNREGSRFHRRERISRGFCHNIQLSGKLNISPEMQVEFVAEDLKDLGEIGRGGFGTVNKMVHRKSNTIMAVKRIRLTVDENEQKQLRDLEVAMWSNDCPFIVQFYGATLKEGDCWICMELMDTSLDKFYKFVYEKLDEGIPENILGKITVATLTALNYLKEKLKLIHRDVKPSNILLDRRGNIKLCDFGISGHLVDSIAKTRDAGCRPYMAPERIDPTQAKGYDVRSDVWSLGITLMELATGSFPYPKWNSVFEQLTQVVQGEPPRLNLSENGNTFTEEFVNFVNTCLTKDESDRPKYKQLLEHPFVLRSNVDTVNVAQYVYGILDKMENNGKSIYTFNSYY